MEFVEKGFEERGMITEAQVIVGRVLAMVPFGTFFGAVGSVVSNPAPELHWSQVFALVCGGLASLGVCAWHVWRIIRGGRNNG